MTEQIDVTDDLSNYWYEHYCNREVGSCSLCGGSGVLDTRGTATHAGVEVGRVNYCICPNGREMRRQTEQLPGETEPSLTLKVWRVEFAGKYADMKMLVAAHTKAEVYNDLEDIASDMRRGVKVVPEQREFAVLGVDVRKLFDRTAIVTGRVYPLYEQDDNG